jgi:GrpB-like predicted nucleotidyltransferase (UPF0157 family)
MACSERIFSGFIVGFEGGSVDSLQERVAKAVRESITIAPYDPAWPARFQEERQHLLECLPRDLIRRIEHFGSTAIPGLAAKPIVDMLVEVSDLEATKVRIVPLLVAQGYDYFWRAMHDDDAPPFYVWFIKRSPSGARTHHIHMVEASFQEMWDCLTFRDYLVAHPDEARAYERLKMELAAKYANDRVAYTSGKTAFIAERTRRAKEFSGSPGSA